MNKEHLKESLNDEKYLGVPYEKLRFVRVVGGLNDCNVDEQGNLWIMSANDSNTNGWSPSDNDSSVLTKPREKPRRVKLKVDALSGHFQYYGMEALAPLRGKTVEADFIHDGNYQAVFKFANPARPGELPGQLVGGNDDATADVQGVVHESRMTHHLSGLPHPHRACRR